MYNFQSISYYGKTYIFDREVKIFPDMQHQVIRRFFTKRRNQDRHKRAYHCLIGLRLLPVICSCDSQTLLRKNSTSPEH